MANRLRRDERVEVLGRLPLFENCTRRDLGEIASMMVEAIKPAGSYLTRQGHDGGLMFVLVEGEAEVLAGDEAPPPDRPQTSRSEGVRTGEGRVISRLRPGDVVGELSLIDGRARSASVLAVSEVRVLEIVSDDFRQLVERSPSFVLSLLKALSLRVREMDVLTS